MKLQLKYVCAFIGLFAATNTTFASMDAITPTTGKVYFGLFGGGGKSNRFDVQQYGTALYLEATGGPLAVDAFGDVGRHSLSFAGIQPGYQAPAIQFDPTSNTFLVA